MGFVWPSPLACRLALPPLRASAEPCRAALLASDLLLRAASCSALRRVAKDVEARLLALAELRASPEDVTPPPPSLAEAGR
jgi:hypothetical protein